MYSPQAFGDDQLAQYTVQFLQNKENANRIFDEVKGQKVIDYIKSIITLDKKEITHAEFSKLEA
jgi:trigger factor